MRKSWFLFFLFLTLVFIEILVFSPADLFDESPSKVQTILGENQGAPIDGESSAETLLKDADQMMAGVHILGTKETGREWELWADRAEGYKENGLWVMSTVKTDFFAVRGAVYRVTGARGKVDMESKNLIISGNVIMISSNGYTFKTDEIVYNSEKKVLTSSTQVKVVGPKEPHSRQRLQLVGDTLESSLEESYMWINGNVKTSKVLQDGRLAKISSASARLSGVNNSVEFSEEVEIDVDGVKVTGPAAVFKYSQQGEILDSVVVKGGARLSDARRWATADRVDVSLKEDKVVFRGNPRLVHGGDELRGEEIIFTKGGKRVQVVKARAKVVDPQGRKE